MHEAAQALLAAGSSMILEANYAVEPGRREVAALAKSRGAEIFEVVTEAPVPVLTTRFQRRIQDQSRHPGHQDAERLMEFVDRLKTPYQPLQIGRFFRRVDTSQPDAEYYPRLTADIWKVLANMSG